MGIGISDPSSVLHIPNNEWIVAQNFAGTGNVNILKVNQNDEIEMGATFSVGHLEAAEDAGAVTIFDMPVSADVSLGDEMSATLKIDGNNILKIYAEADGSGGAQNFKVQLLNKAVLTIQDSNGTEFTYQPDEHGCLIVT